MPDITRIAPSEGYGGTEVTIHGTNLISRGTSLKGVAVAGVPVNQIVGIPTDTCLVVIVGPAEPETRGHVEISANSKTDRNKGNIQSQVSFTYTTPGKITSVTPNTGNKQTGVVQIKGKDLMCGSESVNVSFGGTPVSSIIDQSATCVTVIVGVGKVGVGDVVITPTDVATRGDGYQCILKDGFTYDALPVISSVTPSEGYGGTKVIVYGTNLLSKGSSLKGASVAGVPVKRIVGTPTNTCVVVMIGPAAPNTRGNVRMNSNSQDGANKGIVESEATFTYKPAGMITSVTPNNGCSHTEVTIKGYDLLSGSDEVNNSVNITVGGVPVLSIVEETATSVTVIVGAGMLGVGDVVITPKDLASRGDKYKCVLKDGWTQDPIPCITSITPSEGYGGTEVTIYGTKLLNETLSPSKMVRRPSSSGTSFRATNLGLLVADVPVKRIVGAPTEMCVVAILGKAPPNTTGNIQITGGTKGPNLGVIESEARFTYKSAGEITSVTPNSGCSQTEVHIKGNDLMCGGDSVNVSIGGTHVSSIIDQSATSITVIVGERQLGMGDVVITPTDTATRGDGYICTLPDGWMQDAEPFIRSITPLFGGRDSPVEIVGSGLLGSAKDFASITLGGVKARYVPGSGTDTRVMVVAEGEWADEGRHSPVILSTTNGSSVSGPEFLYRTVITIASIEPTRGQGGSTIVIKGVNLLGVSKSAAVTLNGQPLRKIVKHSNEEIVAIVETSPAGRGDVHIVADDLPNGTKGEEGRLVHGWEQLGDGVITSVEPLQGCEDTIITIRGQDLLGAGTDLKDVTVAGVPTTYIMGSATDTFVQVRANAPLQAPASITKHLKLPHGPVVLTSDAGIQITGPEWIYEPEPMPVLDPDIFALADRPDFTLPEVATALKEIFGKCSKVHQKDPGGIMFDVTLPSKTTSKEGKKYFIKLAGSSLVIRVGGGWDKLSNFLSNHSAILGQEKRKEVVEAQTNAIGNQLAKGENLTVGLGKRYVSTKEGNQGSKGF
jgi:hypothetical protein